MGEAWRAPWHCPARGRCTQGMAWRTPLASRASVSQRAADSWLARDVLSASGHDSTIEPLWWDCGARWCRHDAQGSTPGSAVVRILPRGLLPLSPSLCPQIWPAPLNLAVRMDAGQAPALVHASGQAPRGHRRRLAAVESAEDARGGRPRTALRCSRGRAGQGQLQLLTGQSRDKHRKQLPRLKGPLRLPPGAALAVPQ